MAKNNGWWELNLKGNTLDELSEYDIDHIANMVKDGFIEGQLLKDEDGYWEEEIEEDYG